MLELSKNQIKFFSSLKIKKNRDEAGLFMAEGEKLAEEIIKSNKKVHSIIATEPWIVENKSLLKSISVYKASETDLERISNLKTPNKVIAILYQWPLKTEQNATLPELSLILDDIQDPGNLGTIIRLADWFGIENIVCSEKTAELYNPKVIQSTMGAFLRLKISYTNLQEYLLNAKKRSEIIIYGAFLDGGNIYESELRKPAFIIMGNESKGISAALEKIVDTKITIPSYSKKPEKTESLNVATATAIICAEFRRIFS